MEPPRDCSAPVWYGVPRVLNSHCAFEWMDQPSQSREKMAAISIGTMYHNRGSQWTARSAQYVWIDGCLRRGNHWGIFDGLDRCVRFKLQSPRVFFQELFEHFGDQTIGPDCPRRKECSPKRSMDSMVLINKSAGHIFNATALEPQNQDRP